MLPNILLRIERDLTIDAILAHYKSRQSSNGQDRYFCPLPRCRGDKRPHLVVDRTKAIDQFSQPIDFGHHVNKDVVVRYAWRCEHSRVSGYGSIALLSAILGFSTDLSLLSRDEWVAVIREYADITGQPTKEIEDDARNGWLLVFAPSEQWSIRISDGFSPEALRYLAVESMDADTEWIVDTLHEDLGLWQVEKYCTAGCFPSNDHSESAYKSYERRAHSLFPIFAFCYDCESGLPITDNPEKRTTPWIARIIMPAYTRRPGEDFDWRNDFWTAFCTSDPQSAVRDFRHRFSIYGDAISMEVSRLPLPPTPPSSLSEASYSFAEASHSFSEGDPSLSEAPLSPHDLAPTAPTQHCVGQSQAAPTQHCVGQSPTALTILSSHHSSEILRTKKEQEVKTERKDKNKNGTGKFDVSIDTVDMHPLEIKLNRCVLFESPLDAASTYLWLNYPRHCLPNGRHSNNYWHVAWLAHDGMQLNIFENAMLQRIAIDTFELFGNNRDEISLANTNALRYNYLRLCMLPTSMSEMSVVDSGLGIQHIPHTPIDFFRYYEPTLDEQSRNMLMVGSDVGIKSLILQKELNGSSALKPFTMVPKKKKVPGEKPYTYEININAAWQMMTNKGYCRALLPNKKRDTIGQCYRIDGHFVYELDPDSVMADMRKSLEDYAKDNASDPEDVEMMMNAMLRCKDLQYARNITKLHLMAMPKSESYGPELDYFFFRNGALEITPLHITFRPYSELNFLVYNSQVLPWDYQQPFYGQHSPISIMQSEEYTKMQKEYDDARAAGDKTDEELYDMRQRLRDLSMVGRWQITIKPTENLDERIVVPKAIRDDDAHNEWLRWWPILRLLRCFANEHFAQEESGKFTDGDRRALMARMANLMFTIGRCIFRYRGVQYMPYFLENTVDREGKAQGGSGKSVLIEHFVRFVRYVCNVNGKDMKDNGDFAKNFSNYVHHRDDVVHIEDFPKMAIDPLFNYASGTFRARSLFENPIEIDHAESPNIVITSNFMVQSTDESSLGRVQFGGMSHYFSREVAVMNKEGRKLDTIMPDIHINGDAFLYSPVQRGQIIYTLAKCLQFCMMCTKLNVQVAVPGNDLLERLSRTEMGDTFYDWFTNFLQKQFVYNVPIAINEIFEDYRRYLDPSKARIEMVSRTKFYENLQKYCAKPAHGVLFMPIKPFLSASDVNRSRKKSGEDGTEKSYLRKASSWLTRAFTDENGRVHHARVLSKNAGEGSATGGAVWFSRRGTEPKDADEMQRMIDAFLLSPDPEPVLDENDNPITEEVYSKWTMLNTEQEAEIIRKAGGIRRTIPTATATPITQRDVVKTGEVEPDDSLPF